MTPPVVVVPGWNEGADDMRVFVDGRNGIGGLAARGFRCAIFSGGRGSLSQRVDQLARYVARVREQHRSNAAAVLGYSAGGLIARGVLRRYPQSRIASIFQIAAPNAGLVTDGLAAAMHRIHFSQSELEDLDIESDFLRWLNGTSGRWVDGEDRSKRWKLDATPWTVPSNVAMVNFGGVVPRYGERGDGIVRPDSATLDGHVRHVFANEPDANHLNLGGTWNPITLLLRGWRPNDRYWPVAAKLAAELFAPPPSG